MNNIIAALRSTDDFNTALTSDVSIFFDLAPDILTLQEEIETAHKHNKKLYVHIDLAKGICGDKQGIIYLKNLGADGIISTRTHTVRIAREEGLKTVQRFFVVDSHFLETALDTLSASKADMVEIMPGTVTKVIATLKEKLEIPIIAGGLIETKDEVTAAIASGAVAVSTGAKSLWNIDQSSFGARLRRA